MPPTKPRPSTPRKAAPGGVTLKKQRRTQAERRAASEQGIINAAMRLIAHRGTVRLTLSDLGEEAGYSRGLPIHLFGNKEALLENVVDRLIEMETKGVLREWAPGHGLEALRAAIEIWSENAVRNLERCRTFQVLIGEATCEDVGGAGEKLRKCVQTVNTQKRKQLQRLLEQGKTSGEIAADVDSYQTALEVNSMLRGLVSIWLLDPEGIDLVEATRCYLNNLITRLRPQSLPKRKKILKT